MPAPPNPHWHEENPVRRDGSPYASPYIRKLLRHGLWVVGREVGE